MEKYQALQDFSFSLPVANFGDLPTPYKVFNAIFFMEGQVMNGGFDQYFRNATDESALFLVQSLQMIGATKTAEVCARAISTAFPNGLPNNAEDISAAAEKLSTRTLGELEVLDKQFFKRPEDLSDLLYDYLKQHSDEIGDLPNCR